MVVKGPPTLRDVAAKAGVSLNTVSRSIRAPQTVRPELRRHIERVIREVNYVPNRLAGGLAATRSNVVGVIVTSLYNSEFAEIIETLQTGLSAAGLEVMIANSRYQPDEELRLVRSMLSWRPAALAIVGTDHHAQLVKLLRDSKTPVVELWDCSDHLIDGAVGMDHRLIGREQVNHLVAQGCRRIGFVGAVREHDARARKRFEGAFDEVRRRRLRTMVHEISPESGSPQLGQTLAQRLLARAPQTDGIICNSDIVAMGVLQAARHQGRQVPNDLAVIGFGDAPVNQALIPSLSSVCPPRRSIGEAAAAQILARISGLPPERVLLDAQIITRESTSRNKPT